MIKNDFIKRLQSEILLSDGAWGTELQKLGLKPGECPELCNLIQADRVLKIAHSYVKAGSNIIETNSFGGSKIKLCDYNLEDECYNLNKAAAEISRHAAGDSVMVFGSMGPTGKFLMTGEVTGEQLFDSFLDQCKGLKDGGIDVFCLETFYDLEEVRFAIEACRTFNDVPIAVSFTFQKDIENNFTTIMGNTVEEVYRTLNGLQVEIIGTNCGNGILDMIELVTQIKLLGLNKPILVQSNAGMPEIVDGKIQYNESAKFFRDHIQKVLDAGATIIGGCCGTTPEYISEMRQELNKIYK